MTNEELEKAFDEAVRKWNGAPGPKIVDPEARRAARYFFWAGSEFGLKCGSDIYESTVGKK